MRYQVVTGMLVGLAVAALAAGPVAAQEAEAAAEGPVVQVTAVEYAFQGLPTSLPAGTQLGFTNAGAEVHEMVLVRIADDTTETLDELLAMDAQGRDPVAEGLVEMIGENGPLFAAPGTTAEGTLLLEREGRYVVLCFIPQGLTDVSVLESLGPDTDPADMPPEVQAIMANPPHFTLGMIQEFTVTAPGTEPGPLPEMVTTEDAAASEG